MKALLAALALLSACFTTPEPMTPQTVEESTYKMITPGGGQCTAWVVDEAHLISAGHCCAEPGEYFMYSSTKRFITATVVHAEDVDHTAQDPIDVCLLKSEAPLAPPLELAPAMPAVDAPVGFIGYPLGEFINSRGVYLGDIDGPYRFDNNYFATAPCDRGASGSAMYSDDGVYGVLVRLAIMGDQVLPGDMGCVASPLSQIEDILSKR